MRVLLIGANGYIGRFVAVIFIIMYWYIFI